VWLIEVVAVSRKNCMQHINTLGGQIYGLFNVDMEVLDSKSLIGPGRSE
jgi:hypothetical protein